MKFRTKCTKCPRTATKRSIYQNDSWEYGLCPTCYAHTPLKKLGQIVKPATDIDYHVQIVKMNPVDFYWTNLTNRALLIHGGEI